MRSMLAEVIHLGVVRLGTGKSASLSDWLVTAGAFIGQIERHCFRIACEGKQIVKLEPGYAYGQSISLSFRTFYLCFL
jgi:hypothetical protein